MWLDRDTGRWIPIAGSSFSEAAELLQVWWLEIRGKIDSKMLSPNSTYAAYIVFKVAPGAYGLDSPCPETSVSLGGSKSACHVCFDVSDRDAEDSWLTPRPSSRRSYLEIPPPNVERADGWMELEMGEFQNYEGEDGEVSISLMETSATIKIGLVVQVIEIRPKKGEKKSIELAGLRTLCE
ncbi:F-box protein VBF-like isoform X2 [Panicum virgatum]|uniref:F-box protein VBF-like isoform X2 n=1 Tax=Panicum virgatum TaxID=38727 RepID=UPI0019D4F1EE|nr:F-box protein VBF-like isoform X2 [Panicum virgatum]XP_039791858.1 F-box protein VBF-like isoform X2 [Panicum virgatum]